jgi:hypothetical protein
LSGLLKQDRVEAIAAREQDFVVRDVLAEDQLDERVIKADRAQPPQMAL